MNTQKKIQQIRRLKLEDYQIGRTLGRGGFGKVKIAKVKKIENRISPQKNGKQKYRDRSDQDKYVALKMLKKEQVIKAQQVDHVYNQNLIHSQLDHPFVVNFEGFCQDSKYLYLVLQLVNGGELFTYLRSVEKFQSEQTKFYAASIILCFEYLQKKNIIFRDLKPENILIAPDGFLKLTDFGFAKILNEGRTFTICGTPQYIAPQIILNQGHSKPVDWWTLGVLIYEMIVGIDPFSDEDVMGIYKNILRGKVLFPSSFDKQAKSVVKHLLVADLSKRYGCLKDGVNDLKDHRWFKDFRWNDLLDKKLKAPYVPPVRHSGDVSQFEDHPDSKIVVGEVRGTNDPFKDW